MAEPGSDAEVCCYHFNINKHTFHRTEKLTVEGFIQKILVTV